MLASLAADLVVLLHLLFILFVAFGALLVWRWRWLLWPHLLAAGWGVLIELAGWVCPLTPLENRLRRLAGEGGYQASFSEEYLLPLIYPEALTRELQMVIGGGLLLLNLVLYGLVLRSKYRAER